MRYTRILLLGLMALGALVGLTGNAPPVSADAAAAVSAGANHTCALTTAGGVKCWGSNNYGQVGDGTTTNRLTPVDVSGMTSGVAAVAAGEAHTCALTTGGGVKCWGSNGFGQLGDGTTTNRATPVDVVGLTSGVAAVSAEGVHTCALTTAGGVKCWGHNNSGQVGDGTTTNRLTPVDVVGLTSGVAAVSAGERHTCALTTGGGVKCWGYNGSGRVGDGTTTERTAPVDVVGLGGCSSVPWPIPLGDSDCDGFTDSDEEVIGTDPANPCANTSDPNDEADDCWPSDFDDNRVINVLDMGEVLPPYFGTSVPPTSARRDLVVDGFINILDVGMTLPPYFGYVCG